jgi:hypothetical protein
MEYLQNIARKMREILGFEKRKSQNFGQFFSKIVANKMLNLP